MTPVDHTRPASGSELRRRRDQLAGEVAELHWDLGGLAYEMAIRDHFRLDVLIRRAGMLQERDAELAEVERLLHMQESSVAGSCPSCGAVHSRGAVFCWQCGAQVMAHAPAADPVGVPAEPASERASAPAADRVDVPAASPVGVATVSPAGPRAAADQLGVADPARPSVRA